MLSFQLDSDVPANLRELAEAEHVDDAFDALYDIAEIKATAKIANTREFQSRITRALNTWHINA